MNGTACAHLSFDELACRDRIRTPYPIDFRIDHTRLPLLCRAFEDVRAECSLELDRECPLTIGEGYRTQAYQTMLRNNPRYKAALHSQHCEGRALDVYVPRGMTFAEFEACVMRATARVDNPIRYIELRPSMGYIHFDVRPAKKLLIETVA